MKTVLSIKLEVEGVERTMRYSTIPDCLNDAGLRELFIAELISSCIILDASGVRVAGLPFMTWDNLVDRLISNSTAIYRKAFST